MDERSARHRRDEHGTGNGAGRLASANGTPPYRTSRPDGDAPGGGLLQRYVAPSPADEGGATPPSGGNGKRNAPASHGLLSRARAGSDHGRFSHLRGQMQRLGENLRATMVGRVPKAGEWRASDFQPEELEHWDRADAAPFHVPSDQNEIPDERRARRASDGGRRSMPDNANYRSGRASRPYGDDGSRGMDASMGWDDDEQSDTWETGTWDTSWATSYRPSATYAGGRGDENDRNFWRPGRDERMYIDPSQPMSTMAILAMPRASLGRRARVRMLFKRRPAAATVLTILLLGMLLTIISPLIPVLRLAYDVSDIAYRASALQTMLADGPTSLVSSTKIKEAQGHVSSIQRDLYEINGVVDTVGGPLSSLSPSIRNYRLLVRIGYDLTTAANEGIGVAQTILQPLQGGALSSDDGVAGITSDDLQRARVVLANADVLVQDAIAAYKSIDSHALPSQLQPGTKYGNYLALLPMADSVFTELKSLLDAAPALLGIGQPAHYLVLAMDRSELRAGGGFMGNYGLLTIEGGKQSKTHPLALEDTYKLDAAYYARYNPYINDPSRCVGYGPQPPDYYWWWPYRNFTCQFGWGLRDSNLSPDFPTNARNAMQIVQASHVEENFGVAPETPLQGVIGFTPTVIASLLAATGNITMAEYGNVVITPDNLEFQIHQFQLGASQQAGVPRKEFTHRLAAILLDRLKTMDKSKLKSVFTVLEQAIKSKDLQIYISDPRAELILQQLDLASEVSRGGADGFFVVDTNDGGNKANLYVSEHQTDYVTLLPNGGALHRLQVAVTYDKKGTAYEGTTGFANYSDIQRTYLPADATILGYSGYNPTVFTPSGCPDSGGYGSLISDCSAAHAIRGPTTASDTPGRTMVMGPLLVMCGAETELIHYNSETEYKNCVDHPKPHTQNIYITWYTPHAYTRTADGHGLYSMTVEKQAGTTTYHNGQPTSVVSLSVYLNSAALASGAAPTTGDVHVASDSAYAKLLTGAGVQKVFDGPLVTNSPINVTF